MKIYQCIHKYTDHIPAFERRWGITDRSTFAEIHDALLRDGYASVYRLIPPSDRPDDSVFFTVWNYKRLQYTWACEHGLSTTDLNEIRLAQIAHLKPDIVYDFSCFASPSFASRLRTRFSGYIVAWNGFIRAVEPPIDLAYDGFVSLHRPFVEGWKSRGCNALELQPGIEPDWGTLDLRPFPERHDDLILYGQLGKHFDKRADLAEQVSEAASGAGYRFKCYTSASKQYHRPGGRLARMGIDLPLLVKWPGKHLRSNLAPAVYGVELYEAIRAARAVLNNFTDLSVGFHSNMRVFETIGNGTPLLSPNGVYPDGLEAGVDFLPYSTVEEISRAMKFVLSEPAAAFEFARAARDRLLQNFSKQRQYFDFANFVSRL